MKCFARSLIISFFALVVVSPTSAAELASLHLYVFKGGEPVPGVALVSNDVDVAQTDALGAIHARLEQGDYPFELSLAGEQLQDLDLTLASGESLQIIVTLPQTDGAPRVELESSHQGIKVIASEVVEQEVTQAAAQADKSATIKGQVVSLEGGNPVPGARVFVSGISQDIKTDVDGAFELAVAPGIYSVAIIHSDFSTNTINEVQLGKNEVFEQTIELTPSGLELDEYVVTAPYLEGGFLALANEKRKTSAVAEVIGAAQMSSSGDSNAAGALKRVTGLTVVDGKYIYVRGMGERYSSVSLNGAALPSPNPYRRAVELDLFPTNVLGSVVVQKTYSPDMAGDFGGGAVLLRTVNLAEERFTKVSVSLGGNTQSTLKEGRTYDGGDYDFLGIDDGTREMPGLLDNLTNGGRTSLVELTPEQQEQAGESLPNNWDTYMTTIPPDFGFKINKGDRWEGYDESWGWGYLASFKYNNDWSQHSEKQWDYSLDGNGGLVSEDVIDREVTENEIEIGGVLHLGYESGNDDKYSSTTMLSRRTIKQVDFKEAFLAENEITVRDTNLDWEERQLFTQQFTGEHYIESLHDLTLGWRASYALADLYAPDRRKYRYELDDNGVWAFSRFGESNQRFYDEMTEEDISFGLDFTWPLYDMFSRNTVVKAGLFFETKERDAGSTSFRFINNSIRSNALVTPDDLISSSPEEVLTPENIDPDGYELVTTTQPQDAFRAEQQVVAQYLMGEFEYTNFKVMAGARMEKYSPYSETFAMGDPLNAITSTAPDTSSVLPAMSVTWLINDKDQLRLALSKTVNRPELKEISDARWLNRETGDYYRGNPALTQAEISHLDLRWERYLTLFESVSAAFFYKEFTDPIEEVTRLGGGDEITFKNVDAATNYGFELQGRTWLSRFFDNTMAGYYLESNASVVESSVELGEAGEQMTSQERSLQGQSPWVINLKLGYENLVKMSEAALLFNMAGERIVKVETQGVPDVYEQPVPLLDFVYKKNLFYGRRGDKLTLKLKMKNLLDPEFTTTKGGEDEKIYRKGRSVKVTLEYKFPN